MKYILMLTATAHLALAGTTVAQSPLVCPATSADTTFDGAALSAECVLGGPQACTAKDGVVFDGGSSLLKLPGSAGNFQTPPGAAVAEPVYYAASADFDRDGWEDFLAADNTDRIYMMRNQTITCGTAGCTGAPAVAPTVQSIPAAWWSTLSNVRTPAFRFPPNQIKPTVGGGNKETPMVAGDFNGDGWPDVVVISAAHDTGVNNIRWPTAARLLVNTQNCRDAGNQPRGAGMLAAGQPTNGACSGAGLTSGVPFAESSLSCTTSNPASCTRFFATFASYDLRTGAAVAARPTDTGSAASTAPTTTKPGDFGPIGHSASNMQTLDWDGDGDLDLLIGHSSGSCPGSLCTSAGATFHAGIDVWINDCAQSGAWNAVTRSCGAYIPRFSRTGGTCTGASCNNPHTLIPSTAHNTTTVAPTSNLGFDIAWKQNTAFAYKDIDLDGDFDLVLGSPGCCNTAAGIGKRLRVFKGTSNSPTVHTLDTASPISLSTSSAAYPGFEGSLTGVFVYDFSGDGWPDIVTGSDGVAYSAIGGRTRYWRHTGNAATPYGNGGWPSCGATTAACNPNPTTKVSESTLVNDFDVGFMLDYDNDPQRTRDMALTNGNNTADFFLFPNRATPAQVSPCGSVASGTLPTPASELTVSGACIAPTASVPAGTSITYYLTNEDPANYQLACRQTGGGAFAPPLVGGQCCVTFPSITGRDVIWKAVFDSNTTDGVDVCTAIGTTSPTLNGITANYTFTSATEHYKSGVVISDGVTYVGSFTQPGDRGHLYALAAGDGTRYFDVADKLDAQGSRRLYTTELTGANPTRIDVNPSSPNAALQARLGASTAAQATNVIAWITSPRFGLGAPTLPPTRLGAVQGSTPAILTPPYRPTWYAFLTPPEKARYDAFAVEQVERVPLVLFAAMDGMIHAIITLPTSVGDARNGTEAWGFIPPSVASTMASDHAATIATGALTVTAYPDGSPALVDFKRANGTIGTAAIIADGAGGASVTALDVTRTVEPVTFSVSGPDPLWSHQPGGSAAGKAISKPGVARTKITGQEVYVVVAGTGRLASDPSKGRVVVGYNLETGVALWQFETACALTSDITIFDTDDDGAHEPGNPRVDGFADRAVFADECGYVYKLDPGQNLGGDYMSNTGFGGISIGVSNGKARYALFSTGQAGALGGGEQRPIVGTIGARSDVTTDMVLFFGTGGAEGLSPTLVNEFYAVYAKDGSIRNKLTGACAAGRCEKFYGGVVVTPDTVIVQRSVDPVIGGGVCDFGRSSVQAYGLNAPYTPVFDVSAIDGQPIHAVAGPLYGDAGALYFATVSGEIKRIGAPRAGVAGADSAAGHRPGQGASEAATSASAPFTMLGWRVVL